VVLIRWIALVFVCSTSIACSPGAEGIPRCEGTLQVSITHGADSSFPTREEAAIAALESTFEIDIDQIALVPVDRRSFRVVAADLTVLPRPPRVSIGPTGDGFIADGISC